MITPSNMRIRMYESGDIIPAGSIYLSSVDMKRSFGSFLRHYFLVPIPPPSDAK